MAMKGNHLSYYRHYSDNNTIYCGKIRYHNKKRQSYCRNVEINLENISFVEPFPFCSESGFSFKQLSSSQMNLISCLSRMMR